MPVETIQCPKCGGPLTVEEGRDSIYCSHCGAGLRISTGSSGHPMVTLDDIKVDTSVLAIRATLERLEERRQERDNELRQLETARAEACETEQQRQQQQQEDRSASLSKHRRLVRDKAILAAILMSAGVLLSCVGVYDIGTYLMYALPARKMDFSGLMVLMLFTLVGPGLIIGAFRELRERRKSVNVLDSAAWGEGSPATEKPNQKHKDRLQRLDVQIDEIRSQIQAIEGQRDTLLAKLDSLTDQL